LGFVHFLLIPGLASAASLQIHRRQAATITAFGDAAGCYDIQQHPLPTGMPRTGYAIARLAAKIQLRVRRMLTHFRPAITVEQAAFTVGSRGLQT
jgi:hypothetical protein